jgi:multicomponent Na+:H+ antiporter subunit B
LFAILILLMILTIIGAMVAIQSKDLLSAVISMGIAGFGLTLVFLILQAPDLAIVQIVVETLTLIILVAAILKTTMKECEVKKTAVVIHSGIATVVLLIVLLFILGGIFEKLPDFGYSTLRMSEYYIEQGLKKTGAANLVASVVLDFRAYDTLGEVTVLFTAVMGIWAVLRRKGRKE